MKRHNLIKLSNPSVNAVIQAVIKRNIGLLNFVKALSSAFHAVSVAAVSCNTIYDYQDAREHSGIAAVSEWARPNLKVPAYDAVKQTFHDYAVEHTACGLVPFSNKLREQRGIFVGPAASAVVGYIGISPTPNSDRTHQTSMLPPWA